MSCKRYVGNHVSYSLLAIQLQLRNEHVTSLAASIYATEKNGVALIGIEKEFTKER